MDMHFVNPEDLPPEVIHMLQHSADMHEMSHVDRSHQITALIDELNPEQLKAVFMLMGLAGANQNSAAYFQGLITMKLQDKHGICMCGDKHDPSDLLDEEQSAKAPDMPSESVDPTGQNEYRAAKMEEYGLEEVPIPGNPNRTYLRCKNCQTPCSSLEDRMRRDPGVKGCSGCQQKAKWG